MGILLAVLVSACSNDLSQPTGAPTTSFIGGSQGIAIEFERDAPPPEVTDQGTFIFKSILKLENKGEYEVPATYLRARLSGFHPSDFSQAAAAIGANVAWTSTEIAGTDGRGVYLDNPYSKIEPRKRTPEGEVIDGGIAFITFPQAAGAYFNAVPFPGNTEFTFKAEVCYKYQTQAVSKLCILQNLIDKKPDPLCEPTESKPVSSSGSPVQVSNFRQAVVGSNTLIFSFDIDHSGSGTVYAEGGSSYNLNEAGTRSYTDAADYPPGVCPRGDDPESSARRRTSLDKVLVTVDIQGITPRGFTCNLESGGSRGFIRLIGGQRTVTCTIEMDQAQRLTDFESVAKILLDFNYDDSKSTRVLVKHLIR
ncbi:hypothetical protein HYX09_04330 [Candidatus Woesearchaeota archaeon]|nr:hypothetical protein [Candidatus Woesearchaeota archaeon]